jgi:hypothetical protein
VDTVVKTMMSPQSDLKGGIYEEGKELYKVLPYGPSSIYRVLL